MEMGTMDQKEIQRAFEMMKKRKWQWKRQGKRQWKRQGKSKKRGE